jgi:methionyl-tRNA formyltransferase
MTTLSIDKNIVIDIFTMKDRARLISELTSLNFDILLSNGCPFILPVEELQKNGQLFINLHPTLLPDLKGKTPLSGVFMTHREFIGATMHYIDDGIDTGNIIAQKKIKLTPDIDQGLVYKISFDLEKNAFLEGWRLLQESAFNFPGEKQQGEGSYFNRAEADQTIDIKLDTTDLIIDKVKSFNLQGQGTFLSVSQGAYRIYFAEKITNPYLLEKYAQVALSEVAFSYDNKLVIKTVDGMIKLIDYKAAE